MKRISPARWIRSQFPHLSGFSDDELDSAAQPPPDSVYDRMPSVTGIVLHHSATVDGSAEVFRSLHRVVNGWVDVGYHFIIGNGTLTGDGEIESGRPEWAVGAHTRGHNPTNLGICLVGDFTKDSPTAAQIASLRDLLNQLMERYGLSCASVMQHRDMPGCGTECPGMDLEPLWNPRN